MPVELVLTSPGSIDFRTVPDRPLPPCHIRVQTHLTGIRHGSDLFYLNASFLDSSSSAVWSPPTWGVGEVVEVGREVSHFSVGDTVHGPMRHSDQWVCPQDRAYPIRWLRKEFAAFIDPGVTALRCVRESGIRYGDRVAVFGLGTVGLMAVQYLLLCGASEILALDPLPSRVRVAQRLGAHRAVTLQEPYANTMNECLPQRSSRDIAFDFSGREEALWLAAASLRKGGTLVGCHAGYDGKALQALLEMCDEESIRFVLIEDEPEDLHLEQLVFDSLSAKRVIVWPILSHTFPFSDAPRAYQSIQEQPDTHIKVLLNYR